MKTIGITGGVGAGKSTVLSMLEEEYGAFLIQADLIGHEVMEPGGCCYEDVIRLFGEQVVKEDGTIDRKAVSDVVFREEEKRLQLNAIIHPAVKREILSRLSSARERGCQLAVVEAALLLEDRYQDFLDEIWYVCTSQETRIRRLMESRGYTREKCLDIMGRQRTDEEFRARVDFVLDNEEDPGVTLRRIRERLDQNTDKGEKTMKKTIITVVGHDAVGIIAKVCTYLADNNVNILDISQTIVQGWFNMMMVADASLSEKDHGTLTEELKALGEEIGVVIHCQHEDIFNRMHRI